MGLIEKNHKVERNLDWIKNTYKYIIMLFYVVVILGPLYFLVVSALKEDNQIFLDPFGLPNVYLWENFKIVMFDNNIMLNMLNSFYYVITGLVLTTLICVMASYAVVKMEWKLKNTVFGILLLGMFVPINALLLPVFIGSRRFGVDNPRIILVLIFTVFAMPRTIFILSGFLKDVPRTIEEAAVIDGASLPTIIFSIILPLLKPAIATSTIFNFLSIWNNLLLPLVFINKEADKTLQLGMLKFRGEFITSYNLSLTAVLISIIPTIGLYLFFQKGIVKGITAGSIKG